jgi:hypothetical protein
MPAPQPTQAAIAPETPRPYLLDVTAIVADGQLHITWHHPSASPHEADIPVLAAAHLDHLRTRAETPEAESRGPRAEDFPLAGINQSQLETIQAALMA